VKRRENLETHITFIDFEKAFDRVNRLRLWEILERRGYPKDLVNTIQSLYQNTKIMLNVNMNRREEIINQGVRRGLVKIKIYKTILKPIVKFGCESWSMTEKDKTRLNMWESKILIKVYGPVTEQGIWRI
jgi:hypothetical protein